MTTFPALPTPALPDPPNVPADLGRVAIAAENQALTQYAGYNTTNSPSATSIESRTSAIDGAAGTVAAVEGASTALATNIYTWTGSATSNVVTQATRTNAFSARQTGHDTLINTLNGQLASYEPQITSLINTRPAGLLISTSDQPNVLVPNSGPVAVTSYFFTPRAGTIYYRVGLTGTFNFTGAANRQTLVLSWIAKQGSAPSFTGTVAGTSQVAGANNYTLEPIACYGVLPLVGDGSPWTLTLSAQMTGPDQGRGGFVVGYCAFTAEDLGAHF